MTITQTTLAATRPPVSPDAGMVDLQRYVDMFMRRRWTITAVAVTLFAGVALVALSAPKQYTAMAQVSIDLHRRNLADVTPDDAQGDSVMADASRMETEINILQSRTVAERVLARIGMPPRKAGSGLGLQTAIRTFVAAYLPKRATKKLAAPESVLDQEIDDLKKGVAVTREGNSYIIDVSAEASDPEWAAKKANAFVDEYINYKLKSQVRTTEQANSWLNSTLTELGREVVAADAAVAQYRSAHNLDLAGSSTIIEQNLSAVNDKLVTARSDQAEAEARYSTAKSQLAAGSSGEDVGEALASPVVQGLRAQRAQVSERMTELQARYGPKHPDVSRTQQQLNDLDAQIQAEIRRILSNLAAQAQVARQRTASLEASLHKAGGDLATSENASVQLNELLRKQEAARTTYQQYLSRAKQTSASEDLPNSNARVLAMATVPLAPSKPKPLMAVMLGLGAGLLGGISVMFGFEFLQRGFHDPDDAERRLGVPGLSAIPSLASTLRRRRGGGRSKGNSSWSPMTYVVEKPLSAFTESFRTLRTSLVAGRVRGAPVKVVAVTSAIPGEGKTTTSVCLGRVSAMGAAKTVIVDCDMRRRSIDQVLRTPAAKGLLDVLEGEATLSEALVHESLSGAYILPLGPKQAAHRNFFATPAMDAVLQELREQFDLVILDASPVLALADARVLAQKADTTLLLARWRRTPRSAVEAALRELSAVGANIAGVALTQLDVRQERKSMYGGYYYKQYGGYFAE